ncbi:hypothetical protein [Comamonas sp. 4034]|uniref:hypothetical protein n=1 Tax=Comamonas sp. 4034 TaxID=3156455 RepID=UPI003D215A1A
MATQGFMALVGGKEKQIFGAATSSGAADAGKIPALDSSGKLDQSMMPAGIGANTKVVPAFEAIGVGKFVNFFSDAGTLKVRLADNSNNRPAEGFVLAAVASAANATVYPLDVANTGVSGLTLASEYWLGTAGGVIDTPLDSTDPANVNKVNQLLGKATSATELRTDDYGYQIL